MQLSDLFAEAKPIIAPIQMLPLPGSPRFGGSLDAVVEAALRDVASLEAGGVDGLILENMGDAPFFTTEVPPETVASFGRVMGEVRRATALPVGVNVLRSAARAHGGAFIRVNVLAEAFVTDQGVIEGVAADLMRSRRLIGAENVAVFADVHVKHAAPMLARPIRESALDLVERALADVLVVSGPRTGAAGSLEDVEAVRGLADVVIGSGLTAENAPSLLGAADGAIVATTLRPQGDLSKPVDPASVRAFMEVVRGIRAEAPPAP